ncbi:MAG: hypothetical protein M1838_003782 [Thelocarpon superellum]|nr:MAG: hypothetical protein M1838_003782 [Thelocarpon superellum]
MALESPLYHSPGGLMSAFSPYTDSPASPALPKSPRFPAMVQEADKSPLSAAPESASGTPTIVEPSESSAIASADTTDTEIEDVPAVEPTPPPARGTPESRRSGHSEMTTIDTAVATRPRSPSDETPQSVIHAPQGFKEFDVKDEPKPPPTPLVHRRTPPASQRSDFDQPNAQALQVNPIRKDKVAGSSPVSPPPISTSVPPAAHTTETATPRAQTMQDIEAFPDELDNLEKRGHGLEGKSLTLGLGQVEGVADASRSTDIPEGQDHEHEMSEERLTEDGYEAAVPTSEKGDEEVTALKMALNECWTLCNTLAGLSSIHRERIFNVAGTGDMHEQAWKSCWKLCQKLYDSRDDDHETQVRPTLDLCRDFCQSLFEVRQREDEVADSVLRVSFELNNHLYNTHDRNLPEAFRERTLDFYITLCHRLMKQRSGLEEETDSLLRACWGLAEMLFSLRQNRREAKSADEELLGSAVQACWELCDLFREGWTQVRPDRGTPRPSQTTFTQTFLQMKQSELETVIERHIEPETPVTIFEDTAISPDGEEINGPPNILVLGTDHGQRGGQRWSSNASALSGYSQSSTDTVSTAITASIPTEDAHLTRLKVLIVKAAMNTGFQRSAGQTLSGFVKTLPANSFGAMPWQINLLEDYKQMILTDPVFRAPIMLPRRRAISAAEVARSIQWMIRGGQHTFLRDLFRLVFGFHTDEAQRRGNVLIQT